MSELNILLICQLGMGLFWIITYILVIYKGWRDKQYGMPILALYSLNLSLAEAKTKIITDVPIGNVC